MNEQPADLILYNGKIATQDDRRSIVEALAIRDGKFLAVGTDRAITRNARSDKNLPGRVQGDPHS
jgi:predicted amidohydrolase YtcJ